MIDATDLFLGTTFVAAWISRRVAANKCCVGMMVKVPVDATGLPVGVATGRPTFRRWN
jgi:hypothetical protein